MAYATLGAVFGYEWEPEQAADCLKKAFELKERASERERVYISAHYYEYATGQIEKAIEAYESWKETYPRDTIHLDNLAAAYSKIGQHEKALANANEAMRIDPKDLFAYQNVPAAYLALNRYDEANAIADQAIAQNVDSVSGQEVLYDIAFIRGDAAGMQREMTWAAGKADEPVMLFDQARVEYYLGRTHKAREAVTCAADLALR